jgi:hypothetical protein
MVPLPTDLFSSHHWRIALIDFANALAWEKRGDRKGQLEKWACEKMLTGLQRLEFRCRLLETRKMN